MHRKDLFDTHYLFCQIMRNKILSRGFPSSFPFRIDYVYLKTFVTLLYTNVTSSRGNPAPHPDPTGNFDIEISFLSAV